MKRFFLLFLAFAMVASVASAAKKKDTFVYHSLDGYPVYGTIVPNAEKAYSRLPDSLKGKVRDDLWALGQNSAGISVRFKSDATAIKLKWHSLNRFNMNHMTPTGIRGLDLYMLLPDSTWTPVGSARPAMSSSDNTSLVIEGMDRKMREYMIYLSLYDGVDDIRVGTNRGAQVLKPSVDLPQRQKPIVMYGTSILQGGCATRPGMCHTNLLQSMLNREVINLGFSGNARLDLEIADLMSKVDASVYVIDVLPNCTIDRLRSSLAPFVERLRQERPNTPILLVENAEFPSMRFNKGQRRMILEKNAYLRSYFDQQKAAGDNNLYYFEMEQILGGDVMGTVDNAHMTDLGFLRFANAMYPLLNELK